MRPPAFRRTAAVVIAIAVLTTGCSGTGDPPGAGGRSTPPAAPVPTASPKDLSDAQLAAGLLPEFGGQEPGVAEHRFDVEKAKDSIGKEALFARARVGVTNPACQGIAAHLRGAAHSLSGKDQAARMAGTTFNTRPIILAEAILVAEPAMLDALQQQLSADCDSFSFTHVKGESVIGGQQRQTATVQRLGNAARIGDWSQAYRIKVGRAVDASWVKEVRFGPYLIEIVMLGGPRLGGEAKTDPVTLRQLDAAAQRAYDHATVALTSPPSALPTASATPEPTGAVAPTADMRKALLTHYQDLDPAPPFGDGHVTSKDPNLDKNADRQWIQDFGYLGADEQCRMWGGTLWRGVAEERTFNPDATVALSSMRGPSDRFAAETIAWSDFHIASSITGFTPPGPCDSFRQRISGKTATIKAEPVETERLGEKSWELKITTSGVRDAPTYIKWVAFGPYMLEVRLGTVGAATNSKVTHDELNELAKAAYKKALTHLE